MLRPETNGACHWLIGTKRAGDGHKAISRLAARPTIYRYKSLWGWRDGFWGREGRVFLQKGPSFPNSYSSSLTLSPVPAKRRSSDQRASTPRMSLEETGRGMMPLSKRLHSCWRLLRSTCVHLSALVRTGKSGIPCPRAKSARSRSNACGGIRQSSSRAKALSVGVFVR